MMGLVGQNDELCIGNEELYIENDALCRVDASCAERRGE